MPSLAFIITRVFAPFALGYFLSYSFRTVNAVLGPELANDLAIDAAGIGLLTGAYFLAFAAAQIPLGMALDRFGPRRTQTVLLGVAALGALAFSFGDDVGSLALARALIGAGVSGCLLASFKAFALWLPKRKLPLVNGYLLAFGGLGVAAASAPVQFALDHMTWRELFQVVAGMTLFVAIIIFIAVPDREAEGEPRSMADQFRGLGQIFRSRLFWGTAPLVMTVQAAWMSIQALWLGAWLRDVPGLSGHAAANALMIGGLGMVSGYALLGATTERLGRRGVPTRAVAGSGVAAFIVVQALIVLEAPVPPWLLCFLFGFFGGAATIFYAALTQDFPVALAGRVNTSMALFTFAGAFLLQIGFGFVLDFFPLDGGRYAPIGYQVAFGPWVVVQVVAFIWLVVASRQRG
ncbi:MAG: MFS transporter [Pseudomonadota bacterium]